MKFFLSALGLFLSLGAAAQITAPAPPPAGTNTITLTDDLVLTSTLVITEAVIYEGNGHAIICDGCSPAIRVENGVRVHFDNVRFPRSYSSWLYVQGGNNGTVTWDSRMMKGFFIIND